LVPTYLIDNKIDQSNKNALILLRV